MKQLKIQLLLFFISFTIFAQSETDYSRKLNHSVSGEKVYLDKDVDIKPKLIYGENGMSRNFKFPKNEALVPKIICSFIVETDGTITDIKILNNIPENFSKEAIRVMIKFDEPWYPAVKDNKQVRCQYILPIIIDRI
jgi:protein TonB